MAAPARYFYESPGNSLLSQNFNGEWNLVKARMEPAQFPATYTNVAGMQTTVDPGEVGSESLATDVTGEIRRLYKLIKEIKGTAQTYESPAFSLKDSIYPVGTILQHYDFNGTVNAVASGHWAYCDGSVVSDTASPLNGQTLPDLSGRYIVGAGTDGGGDIDTATWNATVTGVASDTNTFAHTHTDSGHTHTQSHNHDVGSLQFTVASVPSGKSKNLNFFSSAAADIVVVGNLGGFTGNAGSTFANISTSFPVSDFYTKSGTGSTTNDTTALQSSTVNPGQALTTLDIRPSSVRIRHIMRIK